MRKRSDIRQKTPQSSAEPSRKEQRRKIPQVSAQQSSKDKEVSKAANDPKFMIRSKPLLRKPSSDPKREKTKLKRKREESAGIQTPPHKVARSAPGTPPLLAVRKPSSRLSPLDKKALEEEGQSIYVTLAKETPEFNEPDNSRQILLRS